MLRESTTAPLPVYLRVLAYLIGSVGFVALWFAPSLPILALGVALVCVVEVLLRYAKMAANPSIERTPNSQLCCLSVAAHVQR
jgi:hypothetical protein